EEPGGGAGPTGGSPAVNGNGRGWIGDQQYAWFASPAVGDNCGGCRENSLALWRQARQAALAELAAYLKKLQTARARYRGAHNTTAATSDAGGMLLYGDSSLLPAGEDLRLADNTGAVVTLGVSATGALLAGGGTIGVGIYYD